MRVSSPVVRHTSVTQTTIRDHTLRSRARCNTGLMSNCQWVLRLATNVMGGTSSLRAETCKQDQEASVGGTTRELRFAMLTRQRRRRCAMWCGQKNGWDGQILELDIVYVDSQLVFTTLRNESTKRVCSP